MQSARRTVAAVFLVAATHGTAVAQEPLLLSEDAGGILELEGERGLEISGFHGSVLVRQGKEGELRFAGRDVDDKTVERPVQLWLEGKTLRLIPLDGASDVPVRLEVAVNRELGTGPAATGNGDAALDGGALLGCRCGEGELGILLGNLLEKVDNRGPFGYFHFVIRPPRRFPGAAGPTAGH